MSGGEVIGGEEYGGIHQAQDPDTAEAVPVGVDPTSKTLRVSMWKWNSGTSEWERWDGKIDATVEGDLIVAVDDLEQYILDQLKQYQLANFDTSSDPIYVGMLEKSGKWFIKKFTISTGTVTYARGDSGYAAAWADKGSQTYNSFADTF